MLGTFAISKLLLPRALMSYEISILLIHMSMVCLLDKKRREEWKQGDEGGEEVGKEPLVEKFLFLPISTF